MTLRPTIAISLLLVTCSLALVAALRLDGIAATPATLPRVLGSTPVGRSQVHLFLRSTCRSCQQHQGALESALHELPASIQRSLRARIHLWELGKANSSEPQRQPVPVSWRSLGIRVAPTTWFVSPQDSIFKVWVGSRPVETWRRMLVSLSEADPRSHR